LALLSQEDAVANPILNDKTFRDVAARDGGSWSPPPPPDTGWRPPIDDGPSSPWHTGVTDRMTVGGVAQAALILFGLLLISAAFGWASVPSVAENEPVKFPGIAIVGVLVGFGAVLAASFKPNLAKILGPIYALAQGFFVGAISKAYESYQDGIVVQAIGVTVAVFAVMLFLHVTRILVVTDRMRRIIIGATVGIAVFYLISIVVNLVGGSVPFLQSASPLGIAFSFLVAGIAAFNLALDFDFIERGTRGGLPKSMDWFAALGLLVTLVWLYLEILRLLSKLRR
jgi:uncharacterized YccA/Bax inhibitor family protein